MLALLVLTSAASFSGALAGMQSAIQESPDFIFLKLFTTSGNSIPSFASFLAYMAPVVGIVLGFDAISSERSQGTLNHVASQPIYRDTVILAKFAAGSTVILMLSVALGLMVIGLGLMTIGVPPEAEEDCCARSYTSRTRRSIWRSGSRSRCSSRCCAATRRPRH